MKQLQSHWLLCLAKNCDWPRKITLLLNLTRAFVERKVKRLLTVEICVLCSWIFSKQLEIVSETPFSYDTVCHELY